MKKKFPHLAIICLSFFLSVFSIFAFEQYTIEREDQVFYTAPVKQQVDNSLYQDDFLMSNSQMQASLFDELLSAFMSSPDDIYLTYLSGTIVSRWILFIGIALIAFALSKSSLFTLLAPIFLVISHEGGVCNATPWSTWLFSFGTELHARSLAISILTLALGLFLMRHEFWAILIASVSILIHAITALPLIALLFLCSLSDFRKKPRQLLYWLMPIATVVILFGILQGGTGEGMTLFAIVDTEWWHILRERSSYLFIWDWLKSQSTITLLLLPLCSFLIITQQSTALSVKHRKFLKYFSLGILFFLALAVIGFEVFKVALIGQFQFVRVLIWLKMLLVLSATWVLMHELKSKKYHFRSKLILLLALIGMILNYYSLVIFFIGAILVLKKYRSQWLWVIFALLVPLSFAYFGQTRAMPLLQQFFLNGDIELSLGLLFLWFKQIVPPLLLVYIYYRSFNNQELFIVAGLAFSVCIVAMLPNINQNYISLEKCNNQKNETCAVYDWIKQNITAKDLILTSGLNENYLRNHLGKSVFIARTEGGQATFSRAYALEWQKRMDLRDDLVSNVDIFQDYGVDYILTTETLEWDLPLAYQSQNYFVYNLKKP